MTSTTQTVFARYKLKRRTTNQWINGDNNSVGKPIPPDEVLLPGEPGIEILSNGTERIKFGNGSSPWSLLEYSGTYTPDLALVAFSGDYDDLVNKPGISFYQPRETITAVDSVYTLDVTVAKEFVTAAAINGPATFNLSELNQIPTDEVWRGVLRADYTSGLVDLGTLGGIVSYANAISADASVVVGSAQIASGESRAFRWTEAGGMVELGTLGGIVSYATAISADGNVVVGYAQIASGESRAFRWTESSGMVDLGTLGGTYSNAYGISADGSVVVGDASVNESQHAFRWTESSGMVDLGTLGGSISSATAISADGNVVVGYAQIASGESRAFRWTESSGMVDIGTLGGNESYAYSVSADGKIIAGESRSLNTEFRASIWTEATGMVSLGTFGGIYSGAYGISADGSTVVGQANLPDGSGHAFIWKPINWFPANVANSYTIDWASGQPFIPNAGDEIALLIETVGDENIIRVSQFYGKQDLPPVRSVNGKTGNVILKKEDIGGLHNVDNTSDANKPISTATQAALDGKVDTTDSRLSDSRTPTAHKTSHATGGLDELTPADIGAATAAQGAKADSAVQPDNAALTDAREWSAETISQAEAEAGSATTRRAFTAQRAFQAVAAWWAGSASKTKLDGIANGATANSSDAQLRDRSTHTGTQPASTITNLATVATTGAYEDLSGRPTLFNPASPGAIGGSTPEAGSFTSLTASTRFGLPLNAPANPAARDLYAVSNTLRYRDSGGVERLLLNATDNLANLASAATARTNLGLGSAATAASGDFLPTVFTADTITYAATTDLNMAALAGGYRTISLTGNITFTTSNRASGRTVTIRLICNATQQTLTFPAGWVFVGTKPSNIAASKTAILSLTFFGTADTDCVAAYGVQS